MFNVLSLIGQSWEFTRKQTALWSVAFWLLFLPAFASNAAFGIIDPLEGGQWHADRILILILLHLALWTVMTWGAACILVIGKRLLGAKAGRSRTSFAAVRSQASGFVLPLILTGILRMCTTILWTLLLIVPGVIYSVRTVFSPIVVVAENEWYRSALHRSRDRVKGYTGQTILALLGLMAILYLPWSVPLYFLYPAIEQWDGAVIAFDIVHTLLSTVSSLLFLLCLILLWNTLQKKPAAKNIRPRFEELKPEDL